MPGIFDDWGEWDGQEGHSVWDTIYGLIAMAGVCLLVLGAVFFVWLFVVVVTVAFG